MKENPTDADIIAYNLGRLLTQRGLSQLEFAKAIGENRTTVNNWCKGKAVPRFPKFAKMAAVLGCSVSDITELNANTQDQHLIAYYKKLCKLSMENQKTVTDLIDFLSIKKAND